MYSENPRLIFGLNSYANSNDDDNGRDNADSDQCELPLDDECNDKGCDESRYTLDGQSEFLGDAVVDIVSVSGRLSCD